MVRPLLLLSAIVAFSCAGCGSEPPVAATPAQAATPSTPSAGFDAAGCGTINGLVTWVGPIPEVGPAQYVRPRADGSGIETRTVPMANAPLIDRFTRGVGGVVVFLREVNVAHAKPWDMLPVEVEFRDLQIAVKQGGRSGRTGFVRHGDSVAMRSAEPMFQSLRGRGAAYFSLAFPDPDATLTRTFDTCGRIELTSAAGFYWQAADLFVCDHPYYAVTDPDGRFRFALVPAGTYDLVAWHPNWVATRTERSVETSLPIRLVYAPPLETSRSVSVTRGRSALANLTLPK